ncbi:MAG TPA: hypothetical protein EYP68_02140 [Candidatus Korarchaeota archaeon]|nr:hypothetical protein [Candidatus Korarchaeota archaeon]
MSEKAAIKLLKELLPLDRAIRYLVVTAGRGKSLSSRIYESSPFLFSLISRFQLLKVFDYMKNWIKSPTSISKVIIPGSCGKSLDRFGWEAPPMTATILLPPPTIVMYDTVFPPNFSGIFDMEDLKSWYAIYSHPHEDHSPRCLPALINSINDLKLRHILVSRKCFLLAASGSIVYSERLERKISDLIRYMAPERGRRVKWYDPSTEKELEQSSEVSLRDGELKFVCLGEAPHSPPEPPLAISLEYRGTAYVLMSDGAETKDGSFLPVKEILPNLEMLESEKAEIFVVGGILRHHNTYPSIFQAPYVGKALSELGLKIEAAYITHLPSEQYVSLSYLRRKVNEVESSEIDEKAIESAIDVLLSYGGDEEDPIYKFSIEMMKNWMKDWVGYYVPIYPADTVRAIPYGTLYQGITTPYVFWRISKVEDDRIQSELREIESEMGII